MVVLTLYKMQPNLKESFQLTATPFPILKYSEYLSHSLHPCQITCSLVNLIDCERSLERFVWELKTGSYY